MQNGSVDSGNAANGQIPSYDRSVTPVLQYFIDPTMCYLPNGYPSTAYYYGGKFVYKYFWKMTWNASRETLQMQYLAQAEFVLFIAGYDGTGNEWDDYSRYVNSEGVEMTSASIFTFLLSKILVHALLFLLLMFLFTFYNILPGSLWG